MTYKLPIFLLIFFSATIQADSFVNINVGRTNVLDTNHISRVGIEYRAAENLLLNLTPTVGFVYNTDTSKYLYTQLMYNFHPAANWVLSPSFGPALFDNSDDVALGSTIQFRSGIELMYKLKNSYQMGISMYHLSNGGITSDNPGTESVVFSINVPINP